MGPQEDCLLGPQMESKVLHVSWKQFIEEWYKTRTSFLTYL
jgi:hypothetical protein